MSLQDRDKKVLWHPFTQAGSEASPLPIVRGEGAWLFGEKGERYLDAISSWWVNLHGHAHPAICEAISEQAQRLEQVVFAGFTHEPAITFAERVIQKLPTSHTKLFLSDNGSTAVEVGVKMAIQFHRNRGDKKRHRIIVLDHGYHGDTFGAMSVSERDTFTAPFGDFLFDVVSIPPPVPGREKESLESLEAALADDAALAFVFEPLIQGAGGMFMHKPAPLSALLERCHKSGVVTVADEVMTGFGRTGTFFASLQLSEEPDIICLSKGISGGFLPLGATSCSEKIYEAFLSEDRSRMFAHGHSFTGNPLSCAAANASLTLLESDECQQQIQMIESAHTTFLEQIAPLPAVENTRVTGTVCAFDIVTNEETSYFNSIRQSLYDHFLSEGIILRPLGNVIYLLPPYCITETDLAWCHEKIVKFIGTLTP